MVRTYVVPTMPLLCQVYRGTLIPPIAPPALTIPCQLRAMKTGLIVGGRTTSPGVLMLLLVAKGTDIRDALNGIAQQDVVQCPANSGVYYRVLNVTDAAKGFTNEYRIAVVTRITGPIPLP